MLQEALQSEALTVLITLQHRAEIFQILKRWMQNSVTFLFELNCLKGVEGTLMM